MAVWDADINVVCNVQKCIKEDGCCLLFVEKDGGGERTSGPNSATRGWWEHIYFLEGQRDRSVDYQIIKFSRRRGAPNISDRLCVTLAAPHTDVHRRLLNLAPCLPPFSLEAVIFASRCICPTTR
ncbi:hypothetical protein DMN91_012797 [Ooceraea biroi]|uniref:Uncharacterized protein n=1 Tax=Ooceraea biroi TaxID=2015173 RepID=A0A3L8D3E3_OOCBI|nr:hypothetical protein DMN91_012797 [Ooceraea biroi]